MHRVISGTICTIILAGCTAQGAIAPNLGARLIADVTCLTALTRAGLYIAESQESGTVTAVKVLQQINDIGTSNIPIDTLTACAQTIDYSVADAQGIKARIKGVKQ